MARKAHAAPADDAALANAFALLARAAAARHPKQAAPVVERADAEESVRFVAALPTARGADVLRFIAPERAAEILVALGERAPPDKEKGSALLDAMAPRLAATLVVRVDEPARTALLAGLPADRARELNVLASYPPDTAGGRMDPRVATFSASSLVRSVPLRKLRKLRTEQVFLIDDDGRLLGALSVAELVLASPDTPLGALPREAAASAPATTSFGEVIDIITRTGVTSVPVVDFEGRVLGVLRQRELIAAAQDDAAADLLTMVGAGKEERGLSQPMLSVKKRLPWLQVNLLTSFLASAVIGMFEDTIARVTALAILMPIVAGQSGNTGAQSLAVTVRALFMREVLVRDWLRVAFKELRVGALNGFAVAIVTSLSVFAWSRSPALAAVIGASMIISMTTASVAGALVPIVLTSLKQDPAQSSSIILTTITDIAGFFSFLGIATLLMRFL